MDMCSVHGKYHIVVFSDTVFFVLEEVDFLDDKKFKDGFDSLSVCL